MAAPLGVGKAARWQARPGAVLSARLSAPAGYPAALLVALTLLAIWLLSGVPIGDIARFVAFEALYVLLPGCLLYMLLNPVPGGRLLVLAVGWPLGYALEIGAFSLTAALHVRGLFAFLPLLCASAVGLLVLHRRRRAGSATLHGDALPRGGSPAEHGWGVESLVGAIAIAIALVLLAFRFFATYPLPAHANSVFYFVDNVWDVSLAAEALHHWPIVESYLAGHPLRYYVGVFIHVAAIKQVTGVPIATVIFRLLPATATVVAMLQFWCLGGLLRRSRWAGPLTLALLIFVENLKLFPTHTKVFGVALFSEFTWSPTYGFGVIFLLGLLILCRTRLLGMEDPSTLKAAGSLPRGAARVGSPESSTPTAAGSLPRGAAGSLLMLAILILGGGAVKSTAVATFAGGLGLFWLWRLARGHAGRLLSCALAVTLACSAAMYFLLLSGAGAPAATETKLAPLDFLKYTVFGATLHAHPGLAPLLVVAVVMFTWKLLPVAGVLWPPWRRGTWSPYMSLALAVFVVGFLVYVLMGSTLDNETYFVWYGYIALIPVATATLMALWSERRAIWGISSRSVRAVALGVLLLVGLGCVESIALAVPDAWKTVMDTQTVPRDSPGHPGITAALYRGLTWVREHTNSCAILAVNTPEIRPAGALTAKADSGYFYYSAFAEREVFFESWIMASQGLHRAQPYPALFALNNEATRRANPVAVRALARRGVSYILIDRSHGRDVREPSSVSRLVFADSALDVYRLTVPVSAHGC